MKIGPQGANPISVRRISDELVSLGCLVKDDDDNYRYSAQAQDELMNGMDRYGETEEGIRFALIKTVLSFYPDGLSETRLISRIQVLSAWLEAKAPEEESQGAVTK